ncbi:MAG: hypothetical protein RL318_812 [Fibrobacterota bacterium]|jgi:hypothetical protein
MKVRALLALAGVFFLSACESESTTASVTSQETSRLSLVAPPMNGAALAGRPSLAARAEVGGKLVVTLTNPVLLVNRSDTVTWDGGDTLKTAFDGLLPGAGYRLVAQYLDSRGMVTHRDSVATFALGRAQNLALSLRLKAELGKILLQFPAVPDGVDTLSLAVEQVGGKSWRAQIARPSAGRGSLRVDSLPLGVDLTARLRAWSKTGDTLYYLDTTLNLSSSQDQTFAWTLGSALGRTQGSLTFLEGGEAAGLVGFAGAASQPMTQSGRLLFTGFSDSGAADWVRLTNPGSETVVDSVRLSRGTLDTTFAVNLAPGQSLIVTRATSDLTSKTGHPLQGANLLGSSVATVTWSATGGTVWTLARADGTQFMDMVYILPGKNGWPVLNTSTSRSLYLRSSVGTGVGNDAGGNWCARASDAPTGTCP